MSFILFCLLSFIVGYFVIYYSLPYIVQFLIYIVQKLQVGLENLLAWLLPANK